MTTRALWRACGPGSSSPPAAPPSGSHPKHRRRGRKGPSRIQFKKPVATDCYGTPVRGGTGTEFVFRCEGVAWTNGRADSSSAAGGCTRANAPLANGVVVTISADCDRLAKSPDSGFGSSHEGWRIGIATSQPTARRTRNRRRIAFRRGKVRRRGGKDGIAGEKLDQRDSPVKHQVMGPGRNSAAWSGMGSSSSVWTEADRLDLADGVAWRAQRRSASLHPSSLRASRSVPGDSWGGNLFASTNGPLDWKKDPDGGNS